MVMYNAVGGSYALWFLIVLAAGKIIATSLTIGIGGSGGVFAPSLFHRRDLRHGLRRDSRPPARPGRRAARPVSGRRHGSGVRLRGPGTAPVTIAPGSSGPPGSARALLPGPVTHQRNPQVLFASESLARALRQLELYGRDGLPVLSADGQHRQGWITSQNVLQAVARHMRTLRARHRAGTTCRRSGPSRPAGRRP